MPAQSTETLAAVVRILQAAKQQYHQGHCSLRDLVNRCHVETMGLNRSEADAVWNTVERYMVPPTLSE